MRDPGRGRDARLEQEERAMTSEGNGQKLVVVPDPLTSAEAQTINAYWRAAN